MWNLRANGLNYPYIRYADVLLMYAGWDGCSVSNPGFPKDGKWNVRWEGLHPMP